MSQGRIKLTKLITINRKIMLIHDKSLTVERCPQISPYI